MAAVINIQSELKEIGAWLSKHGCHEIDHHYILDKCKVDQAAHLRYLRNARRDRKPLTSTTMANQKVYGTD